MPEAQGSYHSPSLVTRPKKTELKALRLSLPRRAKASPAQVSMSPLSTPILPWPRTAHLDRPEQSLPVTALPDDLSGTHGEKQNCPDFRTHIDRSPTPLYRDLTAAQPSTRPRVPSLIFPAAVAWATLI